MNKKGGNNMQKIYVTSDQHFNHFNIIAMCNRPFKNAEEMNKEMIKRWNQLIDKDDTVFILGDFAFGNKQIITDIVNKLNGFKHLILGNHDRHNLVWYEGMNFKSINRYSILYENKWIMSHIPITNIDIEQTPFMYLYGHIHSKSNEILKAKNSYCVCVEGSNYTPILLTDIEKIIKKRYKEVIK
jgi:calcineurin-like phosphoesterase family protein